jgi:O-antigen/teichoic acid export membrane protein
MVSSPPAIADRLIIRRLGVTLGGGVGIAAFSIVGGIAVSRTLGPVGRGELALLLIWPQLVSTLGNIGVDLGSTFYSADVRRRRNVPATVLVLALAQAAVIAPAYLLLVPVLSHTGQVRALAFWLALLIPVDLCALYLVHALNGRHDYRAFNVARFSMSPAYTLGVVALALDGRLTVISAAVTFLASNAIITALAIGLTTRRHGLGCWDPELAHDIVGFGLRGHLGRLAPQSVGADVVIVALVLSPRELGLFATALAFLGVGRILVSSMGLVVFPETRAAMLAGTPAPRIRQTIGVTVAVMAMVALGLTVVGEPLAGLVFGDGFRSAGAIAAILAAGETARAAYVLLLEGVRGAGRPGLTTLVEAGNWVVFGSCVAAAAVLGGLTSIALGVALASTLSLALLLVFAGRSGALSFLSAGPRRAIATEVRL